MAQQPGGAGRSGQGSNNVVTVASFLRNPRYMGSGKLTPKGCRGVSVLRRERGWQMKEELLVEAGGAVSERGTVAAASTSPGA